MGIKLKYGETPTSRSLRKLPKSGTHAKPSLHRAAFLLVPKTADGRIARIFREKFLSLKKKLKKWPLQEILVQNHVIGLFSEVRDDTVAVLSFSDLTTSKMTIMSIFIISLLIPLMAHEYMLYVTFVASKIVLRHPKCDVLKNV